jgi:hypothetical protein
LNISRFSPEDEMNEAPQQYTQRILGYVEGHDPLPCRLRPDTRTPGAPIVANDHDEWVISGPYDKRDPRKSVERFRVRREGNPAPVKSLEPEQWKHYGMHSERGQESIEHIVRLFAGHDISHRQQMERMFARK